MLDNPFVLYGYEGGSDVDADLLENEYLYQSDKGYIVYDRFFGLWLKEQ